MNIKVGSKILVTNAFITDGLYENGDILTLDRVSSNGYVFAGSAMLSILEFIPVPEEIKDWPVAEIKLYMAL